MAGAGVALTVVLAGVFWKVWGLEAALAGAVFGSVATGVQVAAVTALRGVRDAPLARFMTKHALGMGLRLGGVVLIPIAVAIDRPLFSPLPTALGYLGVLLPLLVLQLRLTR